MLPLEKNSSLLGNEVKNRLYVKLLIDVNSIILEIFVMILGIIEQK